MCEEEIIGIELDDNVIDNLVVKDVIAIDGGEYKIIDFKNEINDNNSKSKGIEI